MRTRIDAILWLTIPVIGFFCWSNSIAQSAQNTRSSTSASDTTIARNHFDTGNDFLQNTQYDSALFYLQKAKVTYENAALQSDKTSLWEMYIQCELAIGDIFATRGEYENALTHLNHAQEFASNKLSESHRLRAVGYTKLGKVYYYKSDLAQSTDYFNKALTLLLHTVGENDSLVANIYENIATIHQTKGEQDQALSLYQKVLEIKQGLLSKDHPDIALTYSGIGNVYFYKGYYDEAIEYHKKALSILVRSYGENHPFVASAYNNIGSAYDEKGDSDRTAEYLTRALNVFQQVHDENHPYVGVCYGNLAAKYAKDGDYGIALDFGTRAMNILLQAYGKTHFYVASCYGIMGNIYAGKDDNDEAIVYQTRALEIYLKTLGSNAHEVADTYHSIADIHAKKGEYGQAVEYYAKAREVYLNMYGENHPRMAANYNKTGIAYKDKNEYEQAIAYYAKALNIAQQTLGEKHPETAETYLNLGDVRLIQNDSEKALADYQKAIISLVSDFTDSSVYSNPDLTNISSETLLLRALDSQAEAMRRFYLTGQTSPGRQGKPANTRDLQITLSTYQLASELIDKLRFSYKAEVSKLSLAKKSRQIYDKAIQTSLDLYQITNQERFKEQAFLFAEKGKSAVLSEALEESRARQFAGIPDSLLQKNKDLRIDLAFYETEIQKEKDKKDDRDSLKIVDFQNRHFHLRTQYNQLSDNLEKNFPAFYDLKYQTETASVSAAQEMLSEQTALVEYFIGDSSIYIFTITKERFHVSAFPKDSTFAQRVAAFYKAIKKVDSNTFLGSAVQLYRELIQPIAAQISSKRNLIIIPDGILYYVPFEALALNGESGTQAVDFTQLPYLITRHEISYHYSATLFLKSLRPAPEKQFAQSFSGFAPVFDDKITTSSILAKNMQTFTGKNLSEEVRSVTIDGESFSELPYSEEEVSAIVKIFSEKAFQSQGYFHKAASEQNFKGQVSNARYLHIATHGILNEEKPKLSGLIFSQPEDSTESEDGILYAGETFNLDLNADLVVLSSCESGLGQLVQGEGLMALTRGFLYSGAGNVIVSLWKVYDKHTSQLMVDFYDNILSGKGYAEALREAKLKMIADPKTAFPKKWSGFVLLGK